MDAVNSMKGELDNFNDSRLENKQTFFRLVIIFENRSALISETMSAIDNIFDQMGSDGLETVVTCNYKIEEDNHKDCKSTMTLKSEVFPFQSKLYAYFRVMSRKRVGALRKSIDRAFRDVDIKPERYQYSGITKTKYELDVQQYRKLAGYFRLRVPNQNALYDRTDIEMFDDFDAHYPWQKFMRNEIFVDGNVESRKFNTADVRKIYSIVDPESAAGKSSFMKWLCNQCPDEIVKLTFGTSGQLRSAIIAAGVKKCYIVDLPRSRGKSDKVGDVLAAIEDTKSGYVVSPMYGRHSSMIFNPPHVFVLTNYYLPYSLLAPDRWETWLITDPKMKLKKIPTNELIKKEDEERRKKLKEDERRKMIDEIALKKIRQELHCRF
jgi:hypothetical protein